jgi:hypothetical protein
MRKLYVVHDRSNWCAKSDGSLSVEECFLIFCGVDNAWL